MFTKKVGKAVYAKPLPLQEILETLPTFTWQDEVFIHKSEEVCLQSPCIVFNDLDTVEMDADSFTPLLAKAHDMKDFLSVADLQDVMENLNASTPNPNIDEVFEAALYYYGNDAFGPHKY